MSNNPWGSQTTNNTANDQQITRNFHVGDVLSVVTGKLLSPTRMDGIYEILKFMTGSSIYTHQIPRAMNECKSFILAQYPALANVDTQNINENILNAWLQKQAQCFGEFLTIYKIPFDAH